MIAAKKRKQFDKILEEVIAELPENVREMLAEVPVIVEDEPSKEILRDMNAFHEGEPSDLCGLHSGIPITEKSVQDTDAQPPVILLFRGPIFRIVDGSEEELEEQIRITLLHEIAHHFGYSEEDLEKIGYD